MSNYELDIDYLIKDVDISEKDILEIIKEADAIIKNMDNHTKEKIAEAYLKKGQCLQKLERYKESKNCIEKVLQLYPDKPEALVALGVTYDEDKEYDKALEYYNKGLFYNGKYAHGFLERGLTYDKKGEHDNAIKDFNRAIKIKIDYAVAFFNRGFAYDNKGKYDKAIEDFTSVIDIKPKYAVAYNNRGLLYDKKGKKYYNEAIKDFTRAIKINNKYAVAYNNRGLLYDKKGKKYYNEAIKDFTRAIKINNKYADAFYNRCISYGKTGEYAKKFADVVKYYEYTEENNEYITDTILEINSIVEDKGLDFLWTLDKLKEDFELMPNVFVRIVGYCMKKGYKSNCHKKLIKAVYEFREDCRVKEIKVFYHYTKLSILEKMYENPCLRLNPAVYQNDPDEGKVLFKHLSTMVNRKDIQHTIDVLKDSIADNTIAFIACFSDGGDKLSMWNSSYAENGKGVSIGVTLEPSKPGGGTNTDARKTASLQRNDKGNNTLKDNPGEKEKISFNQLGLYGIYYDKEKLTEISTCLKAIQPKYYKDTKFIDMLERLFTTIAHIVKEKDYEHEKEYRYIYTTTIENGKKYIKKQKDVLSMGIFIETRDKLFDINNSTKIRFGPKVDNNTFLKYKHVFEEEFNISKKKPSVTISQSGIHFR
ncbi:hypothetical protein AGMMS50268_07100 [Spirochaetia bacterium]|nr:hypothetical protein AGMMS50268_07100 [Spirochaetia bacterium]